MSWMPTITAIIIPLDPSESSFIFLPSPQVFIHPSTFPCHFFFSCSTYLIASHTHIQIDRLFPFFESYLIQTSNAVYDNQQQRIRVDGEGYEDNAIHANPESICATMHA